MVIARLLKVDFETEVIVLRRHRTRKFGEITENKGHYAVQGHSRSPILTPIESSICDFLLVINTNLPPVLHRFRDIAFDGSKIAIFGYPVVFNSPDGGVPLGVDDLRKIFCECTKCRKNIAENFNRLSTAHERSRRKTDDRQTDGR